MLVNRLTQHALGKLELSQSQIKSIEILLKKVAPDLQSVEHSGGIDHRVTKVEIVRKNGDATI